MKNFLFALILLFTINSFGQAQTSKPVIGEKFPSFELITLNGEKINSRSLQGKVVFINFWFTACVPCIEEMPELNKLKGKYADKVEFYAITFDDSARVKRFLEKRNFDFNHIVGADSFLKNTLQNKSYPLNIIIDREGVIKYINGGIPHTKNKETGEMEMLTYKYFETPLSKVIAD